MPPYKKKKIEWENSAMNVMEFLVHHIERDRLVIFAFTVGTGRYNVLQNYGEVLESMKISKILFKFLLSDY